MRLTPPEPDFTPGDTGFDDRDATGVLYDLLGRKGVGKQLSDLVERIEEPLVIALDGDWGSGKSHFLRLWTGAHRKGGGRAKIIYFDAFEHDYLDDPLVGLVASILQQPAGGSWKGTALRNVKSAASKLLRPAARIGLAVASAGASEFAVAAFDPLLQATGQEAEKAIDALWAKEASRKQAMQDFRTALAELAKDDTGNPQKLVFIVDELDRCRPDYALSLLEVIKHFFQVPNVHFVLGVNLIALEGSVRIRYGEIADRGQYLQKFIKLNMTFPKIPENGKETASLHYFDIMGSRQEISTVTLSITRIPIEIASLYTAVSLRDIQRILAYTALLPQSFDDLPWGMQYALSGALILKVIRPSLFRKKGLSR